MKNNKNKYSSDFSKFNILDKSKGFRKPKSQATNSTNNHKGATVITPSSNNKVVILDEFPILARLEGFNKLVSATEALDFLSKNELEFNHFALNAINKRLLDRLLTRMGVSDDYSNKCTDNNDSIFEGISKIWKVKLYIIENAIPTLNILATEEHLSTACASKPLPKKNSSLSL